MALVDGAKFLARGENVLNDCRPRNSEDDRDFPIRLSLRRPKEAIELSGSDLFENAISTLPEMQEIADGVGCDETEHCPDFRAHIALETAE